MDNPGSFQLTMNGSAFAIVGPGTFIGDVVDELDGMQAVTLQAMFAYGSGGTSVAAFIQTSFDKGQTWMDIAAFELFETESDTQVVNLSGAVPQTSPLTPTQQALTAGTCVDGPLGDRLRPVVVVLGTYGSSTLLNLTGVAR
jgi:hypothetical protein